MKRDEQLEERRETSRLEAMATVARRRAGPSLCLVGMGKLDRLPNCELMRGLSLIGALESVVGRRQPPTYVAGATAVECTLSAAVQGG
jgi:hypothetical protein